MRDKNLRLCVDELLGKVQPIAARRKIDRPSHAPLSPRRDGVEMAQAAKQAFAEALADG